MDTRERFPQRPFSRDPRSVPLDRSGDLPLWPSAWALSLPGALLVLGAVALCVAALRLR